MNQVLGLIALFIFVFMLKLIIVMWGWSLFMVPVFGMSGLSIGQAFGFTLLAHCFGSSSAKK